MAQSWKDNDVLFLSVVGAAAWLVPGGGHFLLNEKKRAIVICVTIILTFPARAVRRFRGRSRSHRGQAVVCGPTDELPRRLLPGQTGRHRRLSRLWPTRTKSARSIPASPALLNLLCIVNAVYMAHLRGVKEVQS